MTTEDIPVEILEIIFKNLEAKDVIACRAVCRRWRDVVDSLPDEMWERYCCRDYWNPKAAKKVSNLGFCELYKSLALWSKVEKAEVTCKQLPGKLVSHFKILNNNTLALLLNDLHNYKRGLLHRLYHNQVEYYNMENMKLISCEHYDFYFSKYDENDKLITLVTTGREFCVITKSNKMRFLLGQIYNMSNYTLFDTEAYFVNIQGVVCVARLKVVDGEETIETEELEEIEENVIAFAHATEKSVNMLTEEGNIYCYQYCDRGFETCSQIDTWTPNIIYELWEFGFHWSDPEVYRWLELFDKKQVNVTKLQSAEIHCHNHVVLLGTIRGMVHIFKRPYKKNGELVLYNARPNRSIDMNKYSGTDSADMPCKTRQFKDISQLGLVEISNGHRIVVRTKNDLFFVDLVHKQHKVNKRSATSLTRAEPSTSAKKKSKTVKMTIHSKAGNNNTTKSNKSSAIEAKRNKTAQKKVKIGKKNRKTSNIAIKHVYNTRSKDRCLHSNK